MKNQHINDIFSALAPTESQRRRLLAPPARLQPAHGPGYWAGATALCLAAVLAALWLWPAAPRPLPHLNQRRILPIAILSAVLDCRAIV